MPPSASEALQAGRFVAAEASKPRVQVGFLVIVVVALLGMLVFERWANVTGARHTWSHEEQRVYAAAVESRIRTLEDEKIRILGVIESVQKQLGSLSEDLREVLKLLNERK